MTIPPRVAVVIVTYNSADVLESCLRSLEAQQDVHLSTVVVADNASRDDSLAIAKAANLPVLTVEMGRNAGYAAAINAGVAAMDPIPFDALLVLNPDCTLRADALALLCGALSRPGCGIVAPRLVNPDASLQPSLRRMPTLSRAFGEAMLGRLAGRTRALGELITDPDEYAQPGQVAWATGAAMLISADALRDIGPWDESFLLYSEETEFALRGRDRGWTFWYEPAAEVEHAGGAQATNPALAALSVVNKVRLFRRRNGVVASSAHFLVVLLGESLRAATGRRTSRAAVAALLRPSRRPQLLAD